MDEMDEFEFASIGLELAIAASSDPAERLALCAGAIGYTAPQYDVPQERVFSALMALVAEFNQRFHIEPRQ